MNRRNLIERKKMSATVSCYQLAIGNYLRVLNRVDFLADKAAEYSQQMKWKDETLLAARLYPDMFELGRQLGGIGGMIGAHVSKLTGKPMPDLKTMHDPAASFAEAKQRVADAVAYLKSYKESDFDGCCEREIAMPYWKDGRTMKGCDFLLQYSIPNVYFHLTVAYSILRNNGIVIGKKDYLGIQS
jgi:hypothetical protein